MNFRGTTTGPTAEMARRASRIFCVEDFIRDMENRGEDGYFVSSKWLLSLQDHETESLMSVFRRAGYSGTYQTPTTTLFARIQKDDRIAEANAKDIQELMPEDSKIPLDSFESHIKEYSLAEHHQPEKMVKAEKAQDKRSLATWQHIQLLEYKKLEYKREKLHAQQQANQEKQEMLNKLFSRLPTRMPKSKKELEDEWSKRREQLEDEWNKRRERRAQLQELKDEGKEFDAQLQKLDKDLVEIKKLGGLQKLKDEGEEFDVRLRKLKDEEECGAPLQAHLPKEEERSLLEQRNTEKQPSVWYQNTIEQDQINDRTYFEDGPHAAFLTEIKVKPQRIDEEETLPGIGEHEGATWKSFKVPPQSIKEEPYQSIEEETLPGVGEHQGATWKSFKVPPQSIRGEPYQSIEEETLPGVGEHQGATRESFKAALQSKIHQSFCVSTQWLSNFKDHEDEALKAGYEKISQTKTATWYQKSRDHHVKSPAGGACDDDSYKVSNRHDGVDGGVNEPGASTSGNFCPQSGPRQSVDNTNRSRNEDVEHNTDSFAVATERKRTWVQHGESTCHPQLLRVACSSPSHTPTELSPNEFFHKQQFGDSVVTMPGSGAKIISTTIEKPFSVMKIDFSGDGRGREVPVDLKAIATTSLSCCLKDDHDSSKVRIKFSRISGDVKSDDSYEESCNAMVLSSSYTSVYGCIRSNSEDRFEEIDLNLEDEYHEPPRRRVLANAPRSSGELATTSVDLVWLEITGRTPNNSEPGSLTLALRGDIAERRKEDSLRQIQGVHPLLFKEPRPVIFGGDVILPPDWFLEFRIRSQLEVSYFKPWTPISEEGPVWPANDTTKVVDFGCCLAIRAEDLRLHSRKRRKGSLSLAL